MPILSLLLPLSGVAEEVDTLAVRRFMENPLGLLEGRVAGAEVISSAGVPGLKPMVWMRGVRLHESMAPLYIVDGIRVEDLSLLSPDDAALLSETQVRAGRKKLQNLPRRVKTTPSGRKSSENVPVNLDRQQIEQALVK